MKLGKQIGLVPGHIVLDGDPAPPPEKKRAHIPNFRPVSVVDNRSPISATAEREHLFKRSPKNKTLQLSQWTTDNRTLKLS